MNGEQIETTLKEYLAKFGEITSLGVFPHDNPETKIPSFFAFVAFKTDEAAQKAIDETNNKDYAKLIRGEPAEPEAGKDGLYVVLAMSKRQRRTMLKKQAGSQKNATNIFIKFIKPDVTEEQLKTVLSKFGPITSLCLKESQISIESFTAPHGLLPPAAAPGATPSTTEPAGNLKFAFANF